MAPPVDQSLEVLPYEEELYLESNPDALVCEDHDVTDDSSTLAVNLPPPDEINYTPGPTEYVEVNETLASVENRIPVDATRSVSGLWNDVNHYTDQIYAAALERSSSPDRPLIPEEEDVAVSLLDVDRNVILASQNRSSSPDWPLLTEAQEIRAVAVADAVDRTAVARVAKKAPVIAVETNRDEGEDNCPLCDHHNEEATRTPEDLALAANSGAEPAVGELPTEASEQIGDAPGAPALASQVAQPPVQGAPQTTPAVASSETVAQQVANAATVSEAAIANNSTLQRGATGDVRVSSSHDSRVARSNSGGPVVTGPAGSLTAASAPAIQPPNTIVGSNRTLIPPANVGTVQRPVVPTGAVIAVAPTLVEPCQEERVIIRSATAGPEAPPTSTTVIISKNSPRVRGVNDESTRGHDGPGAVVDTSAPFLNPLAVSDQSAARDVAQPYSHNIAGGAGAASTVVLVARDGARQNDDGAVARTLREPLLSVRGQGTDTGSNFGNGSEGEDLAGQVKEMLATLEAEDVTEIDDLTDDVDPSDFLPSQVYIG